MRAVVAVVTATQPSVAGKTAASVTRYWARTRVAGKANSCSAGKANSCSVFGAPLGET